MAGSRNAQEPVHPRVRGEQAALVRGDIRLPAVHPRVRGEQELVAGDGLGRRRFIPACAGSRL